VSTKALSTKAATGGLKRGPFFVADATREGLTWDDLQTKGWSRLSRGQYAWAGLPDGNLLRLRAATQRIPAGCALSGPTAAWLLGVDMPPCEPIEVMGSRETPIRARAGIRVRRAALPDSDVVMCRGFRITSPLRTACDLGSRRDLVECVVALDAILHARVVDMKDLQAYVDTHAGAKGVRKLRRALALAEPKTESPMETRLRMQLVKARLPRPLVQVDLHDASGNFLGRADLYYPERRLVIEYDGENHKDRLVPDLRRQNALINAGYCVLRFTAADLKVPGSVAAQVRRARSMLAKHIG